MIDGRIIKKIDEDLTKLRYLKNDLAKIKSLLEERLKKTSEEEK